MVLVQTVMRTQKYSGSMGLGVQLRDAKQNVKPLIASDGGTFRVCNLRWASVTRIRITDQDIRNVRLKEATPQGADQTKQQGAASGPTSSTATNALFLPLHFEHHTGDLDEMVKRRNIRALVILNPIGFFYDKGRPRGAIYESLEEFQRMPEG